jgi:hypothetical protein
MRPALQWHQLALSRLTRERTVLAGTPYFTLERTFFDNEYFNAIGILHYCGHRSGKQYELRIRIEYPRTFPRTLPRVFDHDQVFTPSLDGHLFTTHELCLTLPERNEFSTDSEHLTEEILGATLVWFQKRRLFDRNRVWPGPAERHGVNAVIDLLIEQHILPDENSIHTWLCTHASTTAGHYRAPDRYAPCPCGSKKAMKFCHEEALKPFFARLSRTSGPTLLTSALETK